MARIQITQAVAGGFGVASQLSSQIDKNIGLFPTPVVGRLVDVELADDGVTFTITVETPEDFDLLPTVEGLRGQGRRHLSAVTTEAEPDVADNQPDPG